METVIEKISIDKPNLEVFSETHLGGSLWSDPRQTVVEGKKAFAKIWEQSCA